MNSTQRRDPVDEAPPPYAQYAARLPAKSLSPIVLVLYLIACIWAILAGAGSLKSLGDEGETGKLKAIDTTFGVLCLAAAASIGFGVVAAISGRPPWVKQAARLAKFNVLFIIGIGIIQFVFHFVAKNDLINQCTVRNDDAVDDAGNLLTESEIHDWCNTRWKRGIFFCVAWLIGLTIYSIALVTVYTAYYYRAKDPMFGRTVAASAAYRMNPYGQEPPYAPPPPPFMPSGEYPPGKDGADQPPGYVPAGYSASLHEKDDAHLPDSATPTQTAFGFAHPNESTGTLRAVDLNDNEPRRATDSVV